MRCMLFALISLFAVSCQEMADKPKEQVIKGTPLILQPKDEYAGTYKTVNDSTETYNCNLSLNIAKSAYGYSYHLVTDKRNAKGSAGIKKHSDGTYIILNNLPWDEYEGDVNNEEAGQEQKEVPSAVTALISGDSITIQNYGNAMNSYTVLSECGRKYIVLVRHKKSN
ncbi:hypothetical protein R1T16_16285 [Flavobacterium sp. DG1-102-2]|uniref:hypothetical protein n=1 Tax=Flavobacterium sp. DG1-102-2 TaxID=3081663 RepID=UPI00294A44AB|nr:hypothetical protein [Flavobacterium sp. DG1-102-2]MDV6169998.1 hypothetical protein [Flavobacterium sp. DG1-102-2]